jgi:putative RecB family exonuclease
MTVYSHSRLSCFEDCPQKYKFHYIDKIETEVENTVEAYLGGLVHETLEKLYRDLQYHKKNTLNDLIGYLRDEWVKNWTDSILIVKKEYNQNNYMKIAEKFITDYYNRYTPFNQNKTIALEDRIIINLDDSGDYKLQGYIDRLSEVKDGYYEIHDYKTNSRLPLPEYIENDRQLALYAIGVRNRYPDAEDVRLIWHFLAFDKEIDSTRTEKELIDLKQNTIGLIDQIENEQKFTPNQSGLCSWCEFKTICRQWSHLYKLKEKSANEYLNDDGVKLVNRYAELKNKHKQISLDMSVEIEKLEEAIIHFAEKEKIDVVFGSGNKIRIGASERYSFPSKNSNERKELEQLLKKYGKWDEVAQLDTSAIGNIIQEKTWDKELINMLEKYVSLECSKRLYMSKIK